MRKIFLWILMTMTMYQLIVMPSWWPSLTIVTSSSTKMRRCSWVSWMVLFFYRQTNQSTLHDKVVAWSIQKVKSVWKHLRRSCKQNSAIHNEFCVFTPTNRISLAQIKLRLDVCDDRSTHTNFDKSARPQQYLTHPCIGTPKTTEPALKCVLSRGSHDFVSQDSVVP